MTLKLKGISMALHVSDNLLNVRLHGLKLCMFIWMESLLRFNVLVLLFSAILLLTLEQRIPS